MTKTFQTERKSHYFVISFSAMASPCQLLIANSDPVLIQFVARKATEECWRIEQKYSRYIKNNLLWRINNANGKPISIDPETCHLLDYAKQLYQLSDGFFDITSGVLRKAWRFDQQSTTIPETKKIDSLLPFIGLEKITWNEKQISLPKGMELDFGGLGKEYAVDRVASLLGDILHPHASNFLVNFGGDIMAMDFSKEYPAWQVGIESADVTTDKEHSIPNGNRESDLISLRQGGIATSGTTKRYFTSTAANGDTVRYGHILNPKTGFPMLNVPLSVTVFADTCTLAGSLSTLAMLHGESAEQFLDQQKVKYRIIR